MTKRAHKTFLLAGALFAVAALPFVGRWEGDRAVSHELREMRRVVEMVGLALEYRAASAYRPAEEFACLAYRTSKEEPQGLEVCFDAEGRVVETIDRRGEGSRVGSLREQPQEATIRVSVSAVLRELREVAPKAFPAGVDELPIGGPDLGPILKTRPLAAPG